MKSEAEIRKRTEELKEKMRDIKAHARKEVWGEPNYENHLIYGQDLKDSMTCYCDLALLLWVLDESMTAEIDLLTRLDPADEERARQRWKRRTGVRA